MSSSILLQRLPNMTVDPCERCLLLLFYSDQDRLADYRHYPKTTSAFECSQRCLSPEVCSSVCCLLSPSFSVRFKPERINQSFLRVTTRRTSRICLSEGRTVNVYGWNADFTGGNGSFITIQRLIDQHLNLCLATGRLW